VGLRFFGCVLGVGAAGCILLIFGCGLPVRRKFVLI